MDAKMDWTRIRHTLVEDLNAPWLGGGGRMLEWYGDHGNPGKAADYLRVGSLRNSQTTRKEKTKTPQKKKKKNKKKKKIFLFLFFYMKFKGFSVSNGIAWLPF